MGPAEGGLSQGPCTGGHKAQSSLKSLGCEPERVPSYSNQQVPCPDREARAHERPHHHMLHSVQKVRHVPHF